MEEKHKELLDHLKTNFTNSFDVEKLVPVLRRENILTEVDVSEVENTLSRDKAEKLIDIIKLKDKNAFEKLCKALENTFPHLLTVMFLGSQRRRSGVPTGSSDSNFPSLTSDSDENILYNRSSTSDEQILYSTTESRSQELESPRIYTRIIPPHEYDYETSYHTLGTTEVVHPKQKKAVNKTKHPTAMNGEGRTERHRDYDRLKSQCEIAMNEVQSLKKTQEDTVKRCDQAFKESEMYRQNYKSTLVQLQQSKDEVNALKSRIDDIMSDKVQLELEIKNYECLREEDKQEIAELRQQQSEFLGKSGSSDGLNRIYEDLCEKYAVLKDNHELLRKQYAELMSQHNDNVLKGDESAKLRKQYESVCVERDSAKLEIKTLKQQCAVYIHDLTKVQQQRDELIKDSNKFFAEQLRKYESVTKERDAARKEYNLVWAERDSVHKEIEQLQDKVNEHVQKIQKFEKEKQSYADEIESLRREVVNACQQRDTALKERDDVQKRYGDVKSQNEDLESQRDEIRKDYQMVKQERDIARKERHEALNEKDKILHETYERERAQKEQTEGKEHASKETEALKRQLDKFKHDLNEARQEAEKSKKNLDWALGERDKIVQEREGIRSLCESLRHQRDRAVSDKAQALRDYDKLNREKIDACKELKDLREKYESIVEKEARKNQLNGVGHNHSRDSAIDADLQEFETETVEVEMRGLDPDNLGFELVGGKDDPQLPSDNSIFIGHVSKGSQAEQKLKVNDILVQLNGMDVTNIDKRSVIHSLRNTPRILMLVRRRRCITPRSWQPLQLNLMFGKDIGIHIEHGLYIGRINPGSTVAKEGMLSTGDRIVSVNGSSVENYSPKEVMRLLEGCPDPVLIDIWRQTGPVVSPGSSPTPILASLSESSHVPRVDMKGTFWESAMEGCKSNLKTKTSGSQTDSLDSPAPTLYSGKDGKSDKDLDHKVRSSKGHRFDKALEKIFRTRHKSQERHEVVEDTSSHIKNDMMDVPISENADDRVITEFVLSVPKTIRIDSTRQKTARKQFENENSGTWPKCYRGVQPDMNRTVGLPSPQKKRSHERPSIENMFQRHNVGDKTPPIPPERTQASHNAVRQSPHHSPQSSDSTIKNYPHSPVTSPKTSSKSQPYIPSPNLNSPSSQPFTFNPDTALQTVEGNHRGQRPSRNSGFNVRRNPPSSHHHHYDVPFTMSGNGKHRQRSVPDKDKYSHLISPKSSQIYSSTESSSSSKDPFAFPQRNISPSTRLSSDFPPFDPSSLARSSQSQRNYSGRSVPPPYRPHSSYSSVSHSGSYGSGNPLPSVPSGHHMSSPHSLSPTYNSPPYSFPIPDYETTTPSYNEAWCSSPCPSQMSSTPSDHMYNYIPSGNSSYSSRIDNEPSSTFPRKGERIFIPPSVSSSTKSGSVEVVSARSSPASPMLKEDSVTSLESIPSHRRKPINGETRKINIERTAQPVGFQIGSGVNGGVFVSRVNKNSLAAEAGLVIGDQLLEICGINMRTATEQMAKTFLRQTGNTLSLLVQYNPHEYKQSAESSGDSSGTSPVNSPDSASYRKDRKISAQERLSVSTDIPCEAPRWITFKKHSPSTSIGLVIAGGNAVGIFIHEVHPTSFAFGPNGLHCGDQILEYNRVDFRSITAEEAYIELGKPCSSVQMNVQYNPPKYHKVTKMPGGGDCFYVRAHFDHKSTTEGDLSFRRDDILLVANTLMDGKPGSWLAWLVDDDGKKINKGTIPSKEKLEDDYELKRSYSESLSLHDPEEPRGSTRRGSGSARSSFFRRKGKHKRNNSKDSREFNSFSDASLNSDSVPILDDLAVFKYTKVERMEYKLTRPVILLAPLAEPLINKLSAESPDKYEFGQPKMMQTTKQVMEQGLAEGNFIDYWQQDDHFECILVSGIREVCNQRIHCLLNISPAAIERLHRLQIYPIVIFVRHRSHKQLREITDPKFLPQKLSAKAAKDLFDRFHKLEKDYQHQFSAVIQGGNLAEMHQQIKTVIDSEQKKAIWVPVCSVW
ncbi:hypothetical protein FSP39_006961 [Pinctada imbricata]|uniref:Disks large homolog 5-like n=1 Tax=Pinctada imbricata TaxID=66713 RepID=A0AA88XQD2_PINIB|nr:hypothetical protein FSP39_006961 [Pinctada imbricata]